MTGFDTIVVTDWSGGNDRGAKPKQDAIWSAVVRDGRPEEPVYHRNRSVAEDWLVGLFADELAAERRVIAGFDFPFGYPEGFAARVTGSHDPLALWDWFAAHLEDAPKRNNRFHLAGRLNALCPGIGPFWFNGLAVDIPGMISVWPFQPLDAPIALVEVWPSLHAEDVRAAMGPGGIKDEVQVRTLAARIAAMQARGDLAPALAKVPDAACREEGWIFGLGPGKAEGVAA